MTCSSRGRDTNQDGFKLFKQKINGGTAIRHLRRYETKQYRVLVFALIGQILYNNDA